MAISFISQAAAGAATVAMPSHQAGDLILVCAYRSNNGTPPSVPAGYTTLGTDSGTNAQSMVVAYKFAASGSETTGTFTNATAIAVHVYRGSGGILGLGTSISFNNNGATQLQYGTLPEWRLEDTSGNSWVVGFGASANDSTNVEVPPSPLVNRSNAVSAGVCEIAGSDTNGGVTSFGTISQTLSASKCMSATIEIQLIGPISGSTALVLNTLIDLGGIGFIGSTSGTNTATLPSNIREGDLMIGYAFRDGSTTNPSVPAGWTTLSNTIDGSSCSASFAYKHYVPGDTSGTWSSASGLIINVYRRATIKRNNWDSNAGTDNDVEYDAELPFYDTIAADSWILSFIGHRSTDTDLESHPPNDGNITTTLRENLLNATVELASFDTNGLDLSDIDIVDYGDVTITGTASGWIATTIELELAGPIEATSSLTFEAFLERQGLHLISATVITSSSGAMPFHRAGDLIIGFAFRDGTFGTPANPTVPGGWTTINDNLDGTTCSASFAYKVAANNSETTGTWTNATALIIQVYRNGYLPSSINYANSAASSTTVTYPALSALNAAGTSWVAGFAGHRSTNTNLENAPSGMINEATGVNGTNEGAGHSSGGPLSAWSGNNVSVSGTSSGWISTTIEIQQLDRMVITPTYLLVTVPEAVIDGGGINIGPIINTYYRRLRE